MEITRAESSLVVLKAGEHGYSTLYNIEKNGRNSEGM
jgi:hypothetical protein